MKILGEDLSTVKIYRFEYNSKITNPSYVGEGVYTSNIFKDAAAILRAHTRDDGKHPSIRQDIMDWEWTSYFASRYCAFESLELLKEWFNRWVNRLKADGFVIAVYEVTEYLKSYSGKQIMFHPDDVVRKTILN